MSDDTGSRSANDELKNKILSSINTTFTGEATSRWITAMKDDAFDSVEEAVTIATPDNKLNSSMAAVIDRLFDNFKRYTFEFNRIQESREAEINCERPASMRTTAEYHDMGKPIKYCLGHLASRHYALIIQGEENRILIYVTPIEFLMGFKPDSHEFPPYLEIRLMRDAEKTTREFVWAINNEPLSVDSLPVLARRLFTQLIKVAKGEAEYTEPYNLHQEEKVTISQPQQKIDRSFEDESTNLLGQQKPALAERTFVVAAEQPKVAESAPNPFETALTDNGNGKGNGHGDNQNNFSAPQPKPAPSPLAAIANGEPRLPTSTPIITTQALAQPAASQAAAVQANSNQSNANQSNAGQANASPASFFQATPPPAVGSASAMSPGQAADSSASATPILKASSNGATGTKMKATQSVTEDTLIDTRYKDNSSQAGQDSPAQTELDMEKTLLVNPQNQQAIFQAMTAGQQSNQDLPQEIVKAKTAIAGSLKNLFDILDANIKALTAVGLEAMHEDDIETVSSVMKQTKSLKAMRDGMVTLSKEWQKTSES